MPYSHFDDMDNAYPIICSLPVKLFGLHTVITPSYLHDNIIMMMIMNDDRPNARVSRPSSRHTPARARVPSSSVLSTTPNVAATSAVSSRKSSMILDVAPPWPRFNSSMPIASSAIPSSWWPPRGCTLVNSFTVERRHR